MYKNKQKYVVGKDGMYSFYKRKIEEKNLPPIEYEKAIKKLCEELNY